MNYSRHFMSRVYRMADKKHRLYTLYKSTNPKKKYDIYVINPETKNVKKVSFGAKGYQDYT